MDIVQDRILGYKIQGLKSMHLASRSIQEYNFTGEEYKQLQKDGLQIIELAFTRDNKYLVICNTRWDVQLWDTASGSMVVTSPPWGIYPCEVVQLAFCADAPYMAAITATHARAKANQHIIKTALRIWSMDPQSLFVLEAEVELPVLHTASELAGATLQMRDFKCMRRSPSSANKTPGLVVLIGSKRVCIWWKGADEPPRKSDSWSRREDHDSWSRQDIYDESWRRPPGNPLVKDAAVLLYSDLPVVALASRRAVVLVSPWMDHFSPAYHFFGGGGEHLVATEDGKRLGCSSFKGITEFELVIE
jgi:hypothetical protein